MKTCLVTGGCGFIGSNLVKHLCKNNWKVSVVDNLSSGKLSNIEGVNCETFITNFDDQKILKKIKENKFDIIFHLAAIPSVQYSINNPDITTDINVTSTIRLFNAAIGNIKRIVFSSSAAVYGNYNENNIKESFLKNPISPYAWQKSSIEDISKIFCSLYNIDIVCLRYFNVYGPFQHGESSYSSVISSWFNNVYKEIPIRFDGDGEQTRDFVYIDDVIIANELFANSLIPFKGDSFNIATGKSISNNDILKYFKKDYKIKINYSNSKEGDIKHSCANIEKSKKQVGFKASVEFNEGFKKTSAWWKSIQKKGKKC